MSFYDWIVIGAGITGASLAYELAKQGLTVLLLDKELNPPNATRYSYGGLAYWSATTPLTTQIFTEGIALHHTLAEELDADTQFREIDLFLTIEAGENPQALLEQYNHFSRQPELLTVTEACQKEPLLNPDAIAGVLVFPHGQINPLTTTQAYQQAFSRLGGDFRIEEVQRLQIQDNQIRGVVTNQNTYHSPNTVLCAGGLTTRLLQQSGISYTVKFTHEQILITPVVDICLNHIIMPANFQRLNLEQQQINNSILDLGAVPFRDGHLILGQISAIDPNPEVSLDKRQGEMRIRQGISRLLPRLTDVPGTVYNCLVAFADPNYPVVGPLKNYQGLYLFTGFTATLLFAPILARYFARDAIGEPNPIIDTLYKQ